MDYVLDIAERERESEEMAPKRERELGHSRGESRPEREREGGLSFAVDSSPLLNSTFKSDS